MAVEEVTINGNTVFRDDALTHRWYDAIGPNVCKLVEDFVNVPFSAADQMAGWLATLVEGGDGETTVALVTGSESGALLITSDDDDNDGANVQLLGEAFYLALAYPTYIGAKFQLSAVTQSDAGIGLAISDTTALAACSDALWFRTDDADSTLYLVAEKDSVETAIGLTTLVAATDVTAEMLFLNGVVHVYINGVEVAQLANSDPNFPDDEYLTPSICFLSGADEVKTMTVDWFNVIQLQAV